MASAIRFPDRPLSSRAVFGNPLANGKVAQRPAGERPGINALPSKPRSNSTPNVIQFPWDMPRDIRQKATDLIKTLAGRYAEHSAAYLERELDRTAAAGTSTNDVYQYINLMTVGPVQFHRPAPQWTSNVLTAGEWTAIIVLQWNNPAAGPAGSLPGNVVVGGRPWRLRFESFNRSRMVPCEAKTFSGIFPTTAPQIVVHAWFFVAPDPGNAPAYYETNVTFSVALGTEPLVAFPLRQLDPDGLAPFLDDAFLNEAPSNETLERRRRAQEPIRYLVAPKPVHPKIAKTKLPWRTD